MRRRSRIITSILFLLRKQDKFFMLNHILTLYRRNFPSLLDFYKSFLVCSLSAGFPGDPAEPRIGTEGPRGPRGFPGVVGQPGAVGIAGVSGFCEARDCSIYAPVMRKEQGLVKRPAGPKM